MSQPSERLNRAGVRCLEGIAERLAVEIRDTPSPLRYWPALCEAWWDVVRLLIRYRYAPRA